MATVTPTDVVTTAQQACDTAEQFGIQEGWTGTTRQQGLAAVTANAALQTQLTAANAQVTSLTSANASLTAEIATVKADLATLAADLAKAQADAK